MTTRTHTHTTARRRPHWPLWVALLAACASGPATPAPTSSGDPATIAAAPAAAPLPVRGVPALPEGSVGVAVGSHGAVAAVEPTAAQVGIDVLRAGGNAVDAAIAVGLALAVTHPSAGNLGGGGFMLVRMADGRSAAIDYRESAPASASANMYLNDKGEVGPDSLLGPRAGGIPGTLAGLALAHEQFGTRPWAELVAPALRLAREGVVLDEGHAEGMGEAAAKMRAAGFAASAAHYSHADGTPLVAGERWQQPALAATLELLARDGAQAFYRGPLADRMASAVQAMGGLWTREDLAGYRAIAREPIVFEYRGHQILSMPPPSAGGVVLRQLLGACELLGSHDAPWRSVAGLHLFVESARRAYADRNYLLGDPAFGTLPLAQLLDLEYVRARTADVDRNHATASAQIKGGVLPAESPQTTHFSVMDERGNAVANTYTLNTSYGSKVVIGDTGVLMNNEMDDFASKPGQPNVYGLVQGARNRIEPGKRMLSSMTPTLVLRDGQVRLALGAMGGPTISNTVALIIEAVIGHGRGLDEAMRAPRLHHQWEPDQITVEAEIEPELRKGLEALGHKVVDSRWGRIGRAHAVEVDPTSNGFRAVGDVTRDGGPPAAY
jgi:gamma-glutamyltranspeptidase/glutathione hydrolase